ncbi:MAG: hypothetical protein ACRDD3_07885 [Azovibrio sp.]
MPVASYVISSIVNGILSAISEGMSAPAAMPPQQGIVRPFQGETAVGTLVGPPEMGYVTIDEKRFLAAGGLQIRNEMNLIVMPVTVGRDLKVRYRLDPSGAVWRIWILTPAEIAALKPAEIVPVLK